MAHEFEFIIDGEIKTFTEYDDIPETFDKITKFIPDIPLDGDAHFDQVDHSGEEENIWLKRFNELLKRQK